MRHFSARAVLLTGSVFLASGCQPEPEATNAPTLPPPPSLTPDPPETRHLALGFTGLYFAPGEALVLAEGSRVYVDVNWIGGDGFPQNTVPYRIVSGAPGNELSVTPPTVELGPGSRNAAAILVSAVADDSAGELPATYALEIQPVAPLAPGWAYDLSRARMQVTIVEAEPSPPIGEPSSSACSRTSLQAVAHGEARDVGSWLRAVHGDDLRSYFSGDILLRATHPGATLTLVAPYRRPFAHREEEGGPPLYRPYPFGFLFDLDLTETGGGFEQAMALAWFDDLHLRVDVPGCDSMEALCEDGACRVR